MDKTTQKGIAFLAMAICAFTAMDALAKHLVAIYPTAQVVWARNIGQLIFVILYLRAHLPEAVKTKLPGLHMARSLTQLGATGFFFYSLNHIGLAEATALANINPVLITVGAALFLGEKLTRARVTGLVVAMLGALIVLRPGMGVFTAAAVLPIICAFSYAANMLLTRAVGSRESPWAAMFYSALFGTIVTTALLPFGWRAMTLEDVGLFAAVGLLGAAAQLLMIRAYSLTQASVLAPFGYLDMVFAIFWSVTVFGQWPDLFTLGGALVIACAGIYVWRKEQGAQG